MSFPTDNDKRVLIPAVYNKGVWQPFYGGEMPKIKEGTLADIYVPEAAFTNPEEINRFNIDEIVTILPAGSPLWAMMSPNHGMGGTGRGIPKWAVSRHRDGLETSNLVQFKIDEDLRLHLRGTKQAQLEPCACLLECFPEDLSVLSINQAYTRLSEKYEPTRKSHAGNVFTKVFYCEGKTMLPIDELRIRSVVELEKRFWTQSGQLPLLSRTS